MSTHVKPSLNMQKKSCQIILRSRNNQIQNFQAKILQIFELVIWKIDDVINSFWLYLTFRIHLKWKNYSIFLHRSNSHCSCLLCNLMKVMDKFPIWSRLASVTDDHVRRLGKDWVFYCEKDNTGCFNPNHNSRNIAVVCLLVLRNLNWPFWWLPTRENRALNGTIELRPDDALSSKS